MKILKPVLGIIAFFLCTAVTKKYILKYPNSMTLGK